MDERRELRELREREFWDHQIASVESLIETYEAGPDPNTRAMIDAVEPLSGAHVLDFACGTGLTAAWLSDRGATVVGLDVSPASVDRAREFCQAIGVSASFVLGSIPGADEELGEVDRIVGRYALHHVDVSVVGPALADLLRPGGQAAFLETMDTNVILRLARKHLVGRFGIPRYGTPDEHPLTRRDLGLLEGAFGELNMRVGKLDFFRLFDRQVLKWQRKRASRVLAAMDDALGRLQLVSWSYHQVVVLRKTAW